MFWVKVVDLLATYQKLFAVCRSDVWLLKSEAGAEKAPPAQNRTFQSPPGIWVKCNASVFFCEGFTTSWVTRLGRWGDSSYRRDCEKPQTNEGYTGADTA